MPPLKSLRLFSLVWGWLPWSIHQTCTKGWWYVNTKSWINSEVVMVEEPDTNRIWWPHRYGNGIMKLEAGGSLNMRRVVTVSETSGEELGKWRSTTILTHSHFPLLLPARRGTYSYHREGQPHLAGKDVANYDNKRTGRQPQQLHI